MKIIPVVDIQMGCAVRAVAGDRANYQPLKSIWSDSPDPIEVASALWKAYDPEAIYIADLDAIAGRDPNRTVYAELKKLGISIWLDAGIAQSIEASRFVYGLESWNTLPSGAERGIFSIDLKHSRSLGNPYHWPDDPFAIAEKVLAMGFRDLILLDLARVGTGLGVGTESLARQIRKNDPKVRVFLGGGISSVEELQRLEEIGIDGLLIASALHNGRIRPKSRILRK